VDASVKFVLSNVSTASSSWSGFAPSIDTQNFDFLFKLVVLGESGVGKSTLMLSYVDNNTFSQEYMSTIGVDFKFKSIKLDDKVVKLQIWDTAGQERFRPIAASYFRGSHVILLCFDMTDKRSLYLLDVWLEDIYKNIDRLKSPKFILVGCKADLQRVREVSQEEALSFLRTRRLSSYVETSSKNGTAIDEAFECILPELVKQKAIQKDNYKKMTLSLNSNGVGDLKSTNCSFCNII